MYQQLQGKNIIMTNGINSNDDKVDNYSLLEKVVSLGFSYQLAVQCLCCNSMRCITRCKRRYPFQCIVLNKH